MKLLQDWRFAAVVLAALGVVVYGPALNRIFATDQIWYFAELGGEATLSAGLRHLDYNVSRVFWKGDELLFRPVTFGWLAVANWAFSYHHVWWNVANLAIHILVAIAVFRLLITIRPSPLALPAALLFLAFEASMELVVWNHLGGYLLAWLGLVIGLRAFVRMSGGLLEADATPAPVRRGDVVTFALAFTCAALAYELMVPVAGVAALVVLARRYRALTRAQVGLLVAPVVTFLVLYAGHTMRAARLGFVNSGTPEPLSVLAFSPVRWARDLTLTAALHTGAEPGLRMWKSFEPAWTDPLLLLNVLVVVATAVLVGASLSRAHAQRMGAILVVLGFTVAAYPALIAVGRPEYWTVATPYYAYPYGLLGVVIVYTLLDPTRLVAWKRPMLVALVWAFAGMHVHATWQSAWQIQRDNRAPSEFFTRVTELVDAHRAEPGFSFRIESHTEEIDPPITLLVGYPDAPEPEIRVLRMTEVIFGKYYNAEEPMYVLSPTAELSERYTAR